jgi:hypothetical protein
MPDVFLCAEKGRNLGVESELQQYMANWKE